MEMFWIISILIVVVTIAMLLTAVRRPPEPLDESLNSRSLHGSRVRELDRDLADDLISMQNASIAQDEIDRALLDETRGLSNAGYATVQPPAWLSAFVIALLIPLITFYVYFELGEPDVATGKKSVSAEHISGDEQDIDAMLSALEQRLAEDPGSAEGWLLLGRSYLALGRYTQAVTALEKTHEIVGDVPRVLLLYADALAMANGGGFTAKVRALVARCLELEPDNVTALWLSGLAAEELDEIDKALSYFTRARALHAKTGAPTDELDKAIVGLGGTLADAPVPQSKGPEIEVTVRLAPELATKVAPTDTLFVFASAPGTGGPPLAVSRTTANALPYAVVLDESMAMAPMFKLKADQSVAVTARISKSGTPDAEAGDLQGVSSTVVVGQSAPIEIVISEIVD